VLTEWDEFRWLDLERAAAAMSSPAIVDTRNVLDRSAARRAGFSYTGIGRA
jgi:UDPglucose 6-dehydrogenase